MNSKKNNFCEFQIPNQYCNYTSDAADPVAFLNIPLLIRDQPQLPFVQDGPHTEQCSTRFATHDMVPGTITFPGNNSKPGTSKQTKTEDLASFLFRSNLPNLSSETNGLDFYRKMKEIHSDNGKEK